MKGISKKTGQERAVKVVKKSSVDVTDPGKLMDEVKLLIGLVNMSFDLVFYNQ